MRVFLEFLLWCVAVVVIVARELDPAACAARFDVQRDKIIRTEESREMGARYLSELDVGSRHECRRLCCETDSCDVFVYEEKSLGSCYLFNCGPPEDFRCKFTAHGNFSSGVLALSRRLAELQDQERLAAPPAPTLQPVPTTTTTTTTTPPPPPRPIMTVPPIPVIAPTHTTKHPQTSHCSRYQWECHTGGECIAVYNACDGIPQCADGSDEAPELGCPAAPALPALPALPAARTTPAPPPQPPQPVYPMQMYESEAGAEVAAGGGERWPHRLLQAQPRRYPNAVEGGVNAGPHIFSHKGGLVQDEAPLSAFEPPAPQQPWPRRPAWPQHQGMENSGWGGWGRDWADERRAWPAQPPLPPLPPRDREPEMPYLPAKTMPELPLMFPEQQHSLHDAPKKGLGLESLPPHPAPAAAPPAPLAPAPPPPPAPAPADNTTKKKAAAIQTESKESSDQNAHPAAAAPAAAATVAPAVVALSNGAAAGPGLTVAGAAAMQHDEHDGLSEHPPAAVMLLVLGVLMTGAMGVLVGCRARAARRRLRRGGKPYAHDADYLVNGMYL